MKKIGVTVIFGLLSYGLFAQDTIVSSGASKGNLDHYHHVLLKEIEKDKTDMKKVQNIKKQMKLMRRELYQNKKSSIRKSKK